jgi:GNAT superfamily N-acetyltransferase
MADDPEILYWCEMAEAIAWREMMAAVQESGDTSLGAQWIEVGGAVAFTLAALDQAFFNRTVGLGIARQATVADVAQVDEFYRGMGQQWSVVHVAQGAQPPELVEWVEAGGWALSRRWPKLWRTLDGDLPPETTELRIERVGPDRAADFARIVTSAFDLAEPAAVLGTAPMGRTGWSHYLGFDGETAVSAAASYVTADVAWLGWGATLESHRGRGGQSAMFARRLADARTAGCRLAITETGEDLPEAPNPSYRNMLRAGFQVAYVRPNWVRRPPEDQP